MRLLFQEYVERSGRHEGANVLAEDGEQPFGPGVLGVVGLGLLEDFVGERPQHVGEQLLAGAGPAVEGRSGDAELCGERLHVDALPS